MWGAHWSILLEKSGVPGVYVLEEPFRADVEISCHKYGMPGLRRVVIPKEGITDKAFAHICSDLASALTSPLTDGERNPKKKVVPEPSRLVFKGNMEEVNNFFYKNGWSDGLPIVPPTEEAVKRMLKGTSHAPDEIVTTNMLPESYTVTVENVATVGVMAGCEARYMPVLLGMVQAFSDDRFSSSVRSTSSFVFAVVVSGPIAKEIEMNSGINALGSGTGNKANATLGRFLRLAAICLGGSRSGVSDLSSQGSPAKYSFALTENVEKSPWEPFHVSEGFGPAESVVTVMSGGYSHHSPFPQVDLEKIARSMATCELPLGALVIMDPSAARRFASRGYSKQAAREFLWSHATKSAAEFRDDPFFDSLIEPALRGKPSYGRTNMWPPEYLDAPPDMQVPVFPRDDVRIIVVGGETNPFTQAWQFARPVSIPVDQWR